MASVPVLIGLSAMVLGARAAQNGLAAAKISLTAVEFAFAHSALDRPQGSSDSRSRVRSPRNRSARETRITTAPKSSGSPIARRAQR